MTNHPPFAPFDMDEVHQLLTTAKVLIQAVQNSNAKLGDDARRNLGMIPQYLREAHIRIFDAIANIEGQLPRNITPPPHMPTEEETTDAEKND